MKAHAPSLNLDTGADETAEVRQLESHAFFSIIGFAEHPENRHRGHEAAPPAGKYIGPLQAEIKRSPVVLVAALNQTSNRTILISSTLGEKM